ncbi:MAG: hypothetical protein AB1941_15630 [Gemmatimonadota bacterium]
MRDMASAQGAAADGTAAAEAALDAMEEGLVGSVTRALLDHARRAVMESTDPAELGRLALQVFEVFLDAREIHAEMEGGRVEFRNQLRDRALAANGGTAATKAEAEEQARKHPSYLAYVQQTTGAERVKDFAWGLHDSLRICACAALRPELVQPAGPRPFRSAAHTQQGAIERTGRGG